MQRSPKNGSKGCSKTENNALALLGLVKNHILKSKGLQVLEFQACNVSSSV